MVTKTGDRSLSKTILPESEPKDGQDPHAGRSLGLGPLVSLFGGPAGESWPRRAWIFSAALAGLAALAYGVWRGYLGYTRYGNVAAVAWSRPWFLLGGAVLIILALALIRRRRTARRLVALHENGLRLYHLAGRDWIIKWDEMDSLIYAPLRTHILGLTLQRRDRLTLHLKDGQAIRLDDRLEGLARLADQIKARFYPRLEASLRTDFQHGDWITFGPLSIQNRVLRVGKRQLAWAEIRNLSVRSGWLVIEPHSGRRRRLPVDRIPNLEVCLALLQPVTRPKGLAARRDD